jgi:hypothetical protein
VVEEMTRHNLISLIVPRLVLDEFKRNRERIAKESAKSISTHVRLVKEAVGKVGGDKRSVKRVLAHLDEVNHKIPMLGEAAVGALDRIQRLLVASPIDTSDGVKLRAAERAVAKKAPFHGGKNSMADAILIETYAECLSDQAASGVRFAFVTHNKSDFSIPTGNQKLPHPDLASLFTRVKSLYFINLAEALRRVEPSLVTDVMLEQSWSQEPRALSEILEAEEMFFNQVWYDRHKSGQERIRLGKTKIVESEMPGQSGPLGRDTIRRDILAGALRAAAKVEKRYGKENLGPWSDFEWGMINGKLSALRWVMGDEWDMLDT